MSEWKERTLSEVSEITSSKRIFYSDYVKDGVPFWRSKEVIEQYNKQPVTTELFITHQKYNDIKNSHGVPQKDDILLTSVGTLGKTYVVKEKDVFYFKDGNLTWFRNYKRAVIEPTFLKWWLDSPIGQESLRAMTIGSTQSALTIRNLKNIKILLPPLPEQKAIAGVLSSLDDKIDLLYEQNKTLEAMAETLFRQWYIESDEGKEIKITEIIDFNPKETLSKGSMMDYLEMSNVQTTTFHPTRWYKRKFSSGTKYRNYDTLLARITPCLENGKSCYVTFLSNEAIGWGSTEFIVMRAKNEFHPFLIYILSKNQIFRDYAEGCMEGSSGRQRVNVTHLKEFTIIQPTKKITSLINDNLNSITDRLQYNFQQILKLESLRNLLLPKLISGGVQVKS